jgi:hypothetical protein
LNATWFRNLADARRKITVWQTDYNCERPHSLDYRTHKGNGEFSDGIEGRLRLAAFVVPDLLGAIRSTIFGKYKGQEGGKNHWTDSRA